MPTSTSSRRRDGPLGLWVQLPIYQRTYKEIRCTYRLLNTGTTAIARIEPSGCNSALGQLNPAQIFSLDIELDVYDESGSQTAQICDECNTAVKVEDLCVSGVGNTWEIGKIKFKIKCPSGHRKNPNRSYRLNFILKNGNDIEVARYTPSNTIALGKEQSALISLVDQNWDQDRTLQDSNTTGSQPESYNLGKDVEFDPLIGSNESSLTSEGCLPQNLGSTLRAGHSSGIHDGQDPAIGQPYPNGPDNVQVNQQLGQPSNAIHDYPTSSWIHHLTTSSIASNKVNNPSLPAFDCIPNSSVGDQVRSHGHLVPQSEGFMDITMQYSSSNPTTQTSSVPSSSGQYSNMVPNGFPYSMDLVCSIFGQPLPLRVKPDHCVLIGGVTVTITGFNLDCHTEWLAFFGDTQTSTFRVDNNTLKCTVPQGTTVGRVPLCIVSKLDQTPRRGDCTILFEYTYSADSVHMPIGDVSSSMPFGSGNPGFPPDGPLNGSHHPEADMNTNYSGFQWSGHSQDYGYQHSQSITVSDPNTNCLAEEPKKKSLSPKVIVEHQNPDHKRELEKDTDASGSDNDVDDISTESTASLAKSETSSNLEQESIVPTKTEAAIGQPLTGLQRETRVADDRENLHVDKELQETVDSSSIAPESSITLQVSLPLGSPAEKFIKCRYHITGALSIERIEPVDTMWSSSAQATNLSSTMKIGTRLDVYDKSGQTVGPFCTRCNGDVEIENLGVIPKGNDEWKDGEIIFTISCPSWHRNTSYRVTFILKRWDNNIIHQYTPSNPITIGRSENILHPSLQDHVGENNGHETEICDKRSLESPSDAQSSDMPLNDLEPLQHNYDDFEKQQQSSGSTTKSVTQYYDATTAKGPIPVAGDLHKSNESTQAAAGEIQRKLENSRLGRVGQQSPSSPPPSTLPTLAREPISKAKVEKLDYSGFGDLGSHIIGRIAWKLILARLSKNKRSRTLIDNDFNPRVEDSPQTEPTMGIDVSHSGQQHSALKLPISSDISHPCSDENLVSPPERSVAIADNPKYNHMASQGESKRDIVGSKGLNGSIEVFINPSATSISVVTVSRGGSPSTSHASNTNTLAVWAQRNLYNVRYTSSREGGSNIKFECSVTLIKGGTQLVTRSVSGASTARRAKEAAAGLLIDYINENLNRDYILERL